MKKLTRIITLIIIFFGVYFNVQSQEVDVNIYVKSFFSKDTCFSFDYLRLHPDCIISMKRLSFCKDSFIVNGILIQKELCKVFLSYEHDSIIENYKYEKDILCPYIIVDFIEGSKKESISIMKGNMYFRNENQYQVFYLKKEMIDFLEKSFPYIFN